MGCGPRYSFFSFASFVRQPVAVIVCPVIFAPALSLDSARGVKPNASAKPSAPVSIAVEYLCIRLCCKCPGRIWYGVSVIRKRPALFRGRHFEDALILLCVRWYLRYSLAYRDLEEMMAERG